MTRPVSPLAASPSAQKRRSRPALCGASWCRSAAVLEVLGGGVETTNMNGQLAQGSMCRAALGGRSRPGAFEGLPRSWLVTCCQQCHSVFVIQVA